MAIQCTKGKPCGDTCIEKSQTCGLSAQASKALDKLIAGSTKTRTPNTDKKQKALDALEAAKNRADEIAAVRELMQRLPPETLAKIDAHMGAFGASEASKGVYQLPGMKRRDVSDQDVDAMWDTLTTEQKNVLFSTNAGAPDRGQFDLRREEWGGDTDRMRRSMLKAMLEQTNDDGDVIDPWTGEPLEFPADLDHIIPIAKGGGHGGRNRSEANSGYASENWVWVSPQVNQYYKVDDDIHTTYQRIKSHLDKGQEGYDRAVDAKIQDVEGKLRPVRELGKQVEKGIRSQFGLEGGADVNPMIPRPEVIEKFTKDEQKAIMKAFEAAGILKDRTGLRELDNKGMRKVNQELLATLREDIDLAKAVMRAKETQRKHGISKVEKVKTNQAIKDILNKRDSIDSLTDAEMHRVMDRLLQGRPGSLMKKKISTIINKADRLPLKRMSLAPWAMTRIDQKIPDLKKLTPEEKSEVWQYIKDNLER